MISRFTEFPNSGFHRDLYCRNFTRLIQLIHVSAVGFFPTLRTEFCFQKLTFDVKNSNAMNINFGGSSHKFAKKRVKNHNAICFFLFHFIFI